MSEKYSQQVGIKGTTFLSNASLLLIVIVVGLFCSKVQGQTTNECGNVLNGSGIGTGFTGLYAPAEWTVSSGIGNGTVAFNAPTSVTVTGSNGISGSNILTIIEIAVPVSGTFGFNWSWTTVDLPQFDPGFYQVGGSVFQLTNNAGAANQTGTVSFSVTAGTVIKIGVNSVDGCCGVASMIVSAFIYPGACPLNECGNYVNESGFGNGFNGYYAYSNWATDIGAGNGFVTQNSNFNVSITGNNNGADGVLTTYETVVPVAGLISFNWQWTTLDLPQFDPGFFILNGAVTTLTTSAGANQTGTFSIALNAGDIFGFGVSSLDGCCGAATLSISNFTWPGTCVFGCTDPASCNFSSAATADDGSCIPGGCTDPAALNYDPNAQCSSGTCTYGLPNDVCGGAQFFDVQPGVDFVFNGTNTGASTDFTTESCAGFGIIQQDRWYSFEATGGPINIWGEPFFGGLYSPSIAIYENCGENAIACGLQLQLSPTLIQFQCGDLTPGQTYYLQVGGGDLDANLFFRIRIQQSANVSGCTNATACNYNPEATCDDGSCLGEQTGCVDPLSCNYDPDVCVPDQNLCIYPDCNGVCFGLSYLDACGQCVVATYTERTDVFIYTGGVQEFVVPPLVNSIEVELFGAQGGNSPLLEYNNVINQFFAIGQTGLGGKGGRAQGVLPVTPGQILYIRCGGSGNNFGYNGGGLSLSNDNFLGTYGGGATDIRTIANDPSTRIVVAAGGGGSTTIINNSFTQESYERGGVGGGLTGESGSGSGGGTQTNGSNPDAFNIGSGGGGGWFTGGAGNSGAGGSSYIGELQDGSTSSGVNVGNGYAILKYTFTTFSTPNCNLGCTDPLATNFNACATTSDGSCEYNYGCTYSVATNYDPLALTDDGTCIFELTSSCPADLNNDGLVGIVDLLTFVSAYGTVCP
ncbi:MAG: hypothetical protein RL220_1948 [Bacteroidota bacterium]